MDFLTVLLTFTMAFAALGARAEIIHCSSGDELNKAMSFLDNEKDLEISEGFKLKLGLEISQGCNGAADRFKKVYDCLQKVGVDQPQAVRMAVVFSKLEDEQVENFIEIFRHLFLGKYFDSDFNSAYQISLELSKDLKTKTKETRQDFLRIIDLCLKDRDFQIGIPRCAKTSVEMARISSRFPKGLAKDFEDLYRFLRKTVGLDIDSSLKLLPKILHEGPTANDNFKKSYSLATTRTTLGFSPRQRVELALKVAQSSTKEVKEQAQ